MRFIISIASILIISLGPAFAADEAGENKDVKKKYFYEWTDKAGVIHITDGLGKVPDQYRSKARTFEAPKGQEAPEQLKGQTPSVPLYSSGSQEADAAGKAEWQSRISEWKSKLENAQKRCQELDRERNELLRAWGSAALAPPENKQKAEQIEQQMKELQQEIDTARNMLDTVIPEEARKAGVPPGWLRE